jgi:hypothetical protein
MWKKVLFLVAGILAVIVMITGAVASVNADDAKTAGTSTDASAPPPGGPPGGHGFLGGPGNTEMLTRVAQILSIDEKTLESAFKQAQKEFEQKRMDEMFAKLVTDGKLTQTQADEYKAWLTSKPEGVPGFGFGDATKDNDIMSKLLADGKITQAQYDAWKAWIAAKPAIELPKPERPAHAPPSDNTSDAK